MTNFYKKYRKLKYKNPLFPKAKRKSAIIIFIIIILLSIIFS